MEERTYKRFRDQLSREVAVPFPPEKIISLVPSQTELLFDLGLEKEVIGVTKFCVHPAEECKKRIRIGGTKKVQMEKITQLQPDLIIANKEENDEMQIKALAAQFPVWISDVHSISDAFEMIKNVGEFTGKAEEAMQLINRIKSSFEDTLSVAPFINAAYLIWKNPYMTVGDNTFIHSMLELAGFTNVFKGRKRYPETTISEIKSLNPQVILLSSEPYPFLQKHVSEFKNELPGIKIILVDGEMFSWYGSRMLQSAAYIKALRKQITGGLNHY